MIVLRSMTYQIFNNSEKLFVLFVVNNLFSFYDQLRFEGKNSSYITTLVQTKIKSWKIERDHFPRLPEASP